MTRHVSIAALQHRPGGRAGSRLVLFRAHTVQKLGRLVVEIVSHDNSVLIGSTAKLPLWGFRVCHRTETCQLHGISKQAPCSELFFYWFVCPEAQFQSVCLGSYSAANNIRALAQICLSRCTAAKAGTQAHAHMHGGTPAQLAAPRGSHTPWRRGVSKPVVKQGGIERLFCNVQNATTSTYHKSHQKLLLGHSVPPFSFPMNVSMVILHCSTN